MNSKEENSLDFCPNYVQEFGLWSYFISLSAVKSPSLWECIGPTELPLRFGEEVQSSCLVLESLAEIRILVPPTRDPSNSIAIIAPVFI